jgi:hypothetical protein
MELALHKTFCCSPLLEQSAVVMSYITKDGEGFDYISYSEAPLSIYNVKLSSTTVVAELCCVSMQVNICGVFCVSKHDIKGTVVVY